MVETLVTERSALRLLEEKDAPELYAACGYYEVLKNTSKWPWPVTEQDFRDRIKRLRQDVGPNKASFGIFVNDIACGTIGAYRDTHSETGEDVFWLGYMIGPDWWGRGIMTEVVRAVCDLVFRTRETDYIYAEHFEDNPASGAVMKKVGFELVGPAPITWSEARKMEVPGLQYCLETGKLKR